mmetsp:Transcript_51013/g.110689  ORF Transcript_51013/g.110689 Transcript_51013/m.110689 type:complete len:337 (+) Transcript_51013:143-1153(+)
MAFAESLFKIVADKKQEQEARQDLVDKWTKYEATLIDHAVKLFQQRCNREASQRRCQLTASFEVLSRDIPGFPTHVVKDSTYIVDSWGDDMLTPDCWFFATHGVSARWSEGMPILFAEMLESMMPKFLDRLKPLGFLKCCREAGTWKVTASWEEPNGTAPEGNGHHGSFAQSLTKLCADMLREESGREKSAQKWRAYESKLIDQAVELFKQRCVREAEQERCQATVSFEVLSREIPDFPKRILQDSNYFVDSWGEDLSGDSWFYATRGTSASWSSGMPILFAEVLEGMMLKFVDRLKPLGFRSCGREAGTWKVTVSWPDPDEPAEKKRKSSAGSDS